MQTHAGCPSVHLHSKLTSLPKKVTLATCFLSTCCSKQLSKGAPNGNKTELQSAHCLLLVHLLFEECEVADLLIFYRALNHMQTGSFWSFLTKLSNSPRICRSDTERISHQMVKTGVFQQALSRLFHLLWISRTLPDECLKSRLYQDIRVDSKGGTIHYIQWSTSFMVPKKKMCIAAKPANWCNKFHHAVAGWSELQVYPKTQGTWGVKFHPSQPTMYQ